jgi:hypothetical protein
MKKYDVHKWKDGELNERLMEKWGYKKKVIKESEEKEEIDERRRTADRTQGRPVGPGRTKVSEGEEEAEGGAHAGIPHVGAGDIEGMAHAAIAAIVQLADQAGVQLDVTGRDEDEFGDEDIMDDAPEASAEAGEEELLSPEDI